MSNELIETVERLKIILVSRATGGVVNEPEYRSLRQALMDMPRAIPLLPVCVRRCRNSDEFWQFIQPKFSTYAERRSYLNDEFDPLLSMLETESRTPSDAAINAAMASVSSAYIQEFWHKALERRSTDPEGAITVARTLLESVCKHILDQAAIAYTDNTELPGLYSQAAKHLNLSPSQHTEHVFKQILGGCQSVVEGLGALRNRHSDAHARSSTATKPAGRHAELAVNLSGAMATFLLQTLEARGKSTIE